jgi:hypothetical protein
MFTTLYHQAFKPNGTEKMIESTIVGQQWDYHFDIKSPVYQILKSLYIPLLLCGVPPSDCDPSLTMRKVSDKPKLRDILQNS